MFNSARPILKPSLRLPYTQIALAILSFPLTNFSQAKKKRTSVIFLAISGLLWPGSALQYNTNYYVYVLLLLVQGYLFCLQVFLQCMCSSLYINPDYALFFFFFFQGCWIHVCTLISLNRSISLSMACMEVHIQEELFNDLLYFFVKSSVFLCSWRH